MIKYINEKGMANFAVIILVLISLPIVIYLVRSKNSTNLQSKASSSIISSFEIRDANGKISQCSENTEKGIPICEVETLEFTVSLKDPAAIMAVPK